MKPETKFILLRISIYLTGFLVIVWVIGINVWEIKSKTAPLIQAENGNYFVYTDRNYDRAELTLNFETEIPENLQVKISKDFSVFSSHRKKGIYEEAKLQEKLFKNNPTQYPNGSFLKFKNKLYFLDEGTLLPLASFSILEIFNLDKKNLAEINAEDFEELPKEDLLTTASIRENFPENIIIKKDDTSYITGSDGYYPLYIANIAQIIKDLNHTYIEIKSIPTEAKCYKNQNSQAICEFKLNNKNLSIGNVYKVIISENNKILNSKNLSVKLFNNLNLIEFLTETGKLFIQ